MPDGSIGKDRWLVLNQWVTKYSELLNGPSDLITDTSADFWVNEPQAGPPTNLIDTGMQQPITLQKVKLALTRAKNSTSLGFDSIPVEVLRNSTAMEFLLHLHNKCFDTSLVTDIWQKGIITPISKDITKDQLVPLNYQESHWLHQYTRSIIVFGISSWISG